jgi:hypothetical protein
MCGRRLHILIDKYERKESDHMAIDMQKTYEYTEAMFESVTTIME